MSKHHNKSSQRRPFSAKLQSVSIESYISNPNQQIILDSPRSVEALKLLGYTQEDLFYIPIQDYPQIDQSFRSLTPGRQRKRYESYNELRVRKIQQVSKLREQIKLEDIKQMQPSNQDYNIKSVRSSNTLDINLQSTAIENEKKQFELIKRRNEKDLLNIVEYELQRQVMKKEAEARMRRQQLKLEAYKQVVSARRVLELEKKKERERQENLKREQEEEERKIKDREVYNKEQQRLKNEMKKEKERLEENKRRHELEEKKRKEFEEKVNKMNEEYNRKIYEKLDEMNKKEEERKKSLEIKRFQNIKEQKEKEIKKKMQIEKNKENLENHLEDIRNLFLLKEQKNKEKKRRLDKKKKEEYKRRMYKAKLRTENTKKVLKKDKAIQKKKLDDYNNKQNEIAQRKIELEKKQQIEQEERLQRNMEREERRQRNLENNQKILNKNISNIKKKIEVKEKSTNEILLRKSNEYEEKAEERNEKYMIRQDNVKRTERIKMLERENTEKWIQEKRQKIEMMKEQQKYIAERKRELKDEIARKKEIYDREFQSMFHNKNIDQKIINKIHNMFPDNERINILLMKLAELEKEEEDDRKQYALRTKEIKDQLKQSMIEVKRSFQSEKKGKKLFKNNETEYEKENNIKRPLSEKKKIQFNKDYQSEDNKEDLFEDNKDDFSEDNNILLISEPFQVNHSSSEKEREYPSKVKESKKNKSNIKNKRSKDTQKKKMEELDEMEIENKLQDYKKKLSNELTVLINKEKEKEAERINLYNNSPSEDKKKLMKELDEEKAKVSLLIKKKKE